MKKKKGILILSHQGFSFLDDVIAAATRLGLESYVLSSRPATNVADRAAYLRSQSDWARVTSRPKLEAADVTRALSVLSRSKRVVACLTVWEGYRGLMAEANRKLGARDESAATLEMLLDKHAMRLTLKRAGLSRIESVVLTPRTLREAKQWGDAKFIKPRSGLGSFATFRLSPETTYARIRELQWEMAEDREYASVFDKTLDFVIEDYISGVEVSFEAFAVDGELHLLAVHEKVEVEEKGRTVLENSSACPPVSIPRETLLEGRGYLRRCFSALGITTGCYHVEAKWDPSTDRWEIVEINPRVGGALIKESVRAVTGGLDLIETWIRLLVAPTPHERRRIRLMLSRHSTLRASSRRVSGTFFKVYFGEPGKTIRQVRRVPLAPVPDIFRLAVKEGAALPEASREIFLGQALWKFRGVASRPTLNFLKKVSNDLLEVTYANARI